MTKEALIIAHGTPGKGGIGMQHCNSAEISIQYAISVLEELREEFKKYIMIYHVTTTHMKIQKLKDLIK